MQFLRNAFDVIQTIDTDNELYTLKLSFERGDSFLYLGFLEAFLEFLGVNTNGKGAYGDNFVLEFDTVWCSWKSSVILISYGWGLARQLSLQYA